MGRPYACDRPTALDRYAPERHAVDRWYFVISGFTQTLSTPSGCQQLWHCLDRERHHARAKAMLWPWNADWRGVAELVWRFRPFDRRPRVYTFAYSWGGGHGMPRFADELARRGIDIDHAVLCDAVYRAPLRALDFLSLTNWPRPRIVVPRNVRQVDWFFQRADHWYNPRGHEPVAAAGAQTVIHPGQELFAAHHYMDDQPEWWQKCLDVAAHPEHAAGQARTAECDMEVAVLPLHAGVTH
ncbi:MAG TPA: hypothetical protein VFW87_01880 [Pirellulales bacterium]|nr:hypothetical protein [Pirellulales bacterium]